MQNSFMDILFPQNECCVCREAGRYNTRHPWCNQCQEKMDNLRTAMPTCDYCGKYLLNGGSRCEECQVEKPPFNIARAVGPYEEPYRIAIKVLKFLGRRQLGYCMGIMMAEVVREEPLFWPINIIVPVPSSKASMKQRGFNQTEVLGQQIGKCLKLPINAEVLRRIKETPSQRECTREERERNLWRAFEVKDKSKIRGKSILLVDDVYTTGSTSRECSRTLLDAGAERVGVIVWAIGTGY